MTNRASFRIPIIQRALRRHERQVLRAAAFKDGYNAGPDRPTNHQLNKLVDTSLIVVGGPCKITGRSSVIYFEDDVQLIPNPVYRDVQNSVTGAEDVRLVTMIVGLLRTPDGRAPSQRVVAHHALQLYRRWSRLIGCQQSRRADRWRGWRALRVSSCGHFQDARIFDRRAALWRRGVDGVYSGPLPRSRDADAFYT